MPTRVLVADDHLAIREGIRSLLAPDDELLIVGEAADGVQASRMALELKPDLILLDNSMPGKTGLEVARELKPLLPDASIVRSHSLSKLMERFAKFAEPMRSHSSSTIMTFEWMSRQVPSQSPGTSG